MIDYGFKKILDCSFEAAVDKVKKELKKQDFGVLTEIDVREKFREKLDEDFKQYLILGACNPANALEAISVEEDIGLFLPCNVIVYEKGENTAVSIVRPTRAMQAVENEALAGVAREVEAALEKVAGNLT